MSAVIGTFPQDRSLGYVWGDAADEMLVFIVCKRCYLLRFGKMKGDLSVQWVKAGCPNGFMLKTDFSDGSYLLYILSEDRPCRIDVRH